MIFMERYIPQEYRSGGLEYLCTIRGEGGKRKGFFREVKRRGIWEDGTQPSFYPSHGSSYTCFRLCLASEDPELRIDIYRVKKKHVGVRAGNISNITFHRQLGEITTPLLQAGYSVSLIQDPPEGSPF